MLLDDNSFSRLLNLNYYNPKNVLLGLIYIRYNIFMVSNLRIHIEITCGLIANGTILYFLIDILALTLLVPLMLKRYEL